LETYIIKLGAVKLVIRLGYGEQFDDHTKIVQVLGSHNGGGLDVLFLRMRIVVVSDEKEAARGEVWSLCGEDLVCTEEDSGHFDGLVTRYEQSLGLFFIFDNGPKSLDVGGSRYIEIGEDIAVWILQLAFAVLFLVLKSCVFCAEE